MKKVLFLLVMLFTLVATQAQSLNETVKNVGQTAQAINQTVQTVQNVPLTSADAQANTDIAKAVPDSGKLTAMKVYGDVKAGLVGIASALKTTAEHVYVILVRQQIVKSIMWTILGIIGLICFLTYKKLYTFGNENSYDSDGASFIPFVLQIILGCVLIGLFLGNINTVVTGFVNPEYGALKEIMEFISPTNK